MVLGGAGRRRTLAFPAAGNPPAVGKAPGHPRWRECVAVSRGLAGDPVHGAAGHDVFQRVRVDGAYPARPGDRREHGRADRLGVDCASDAGLIVCPCAGHAFQGPEDHQHGGGADDRRRFRAHDLWPHGAHLDVDRAQRAGAGVAHRGGPDHDHGPHTRRPHGRTLVRDDAGRRLRGGFAGHLDGRASSTKPRAVSQRLESCSWWSVRWRRSSDTGQAATASFNPSRSQQCAF